MSTSPEVVICNQPWYYYDNGWRFGVRAGSRWPHTLTRPGGYKPFPFFLAYAQSWLMHLGIESVFIDAITMRMTYAQFYNKLMRLQPEYAVLDTSTPSITNDLQVAEYVHGLGIKVILTGPHATVFADELVQLPFVHAVVKGELEIPLVEALRSGKPGIYGPAPVKDIDVLPWPYRDESLWLYQERTHGYVPKQISLLSSRGCPYQCSFCQWPVVMYDGKYRSRSIKNVEEEIAYLIREYGDDIFLYFDDDTFNLSERRTVQMASMIGQFGVLWSAMCRLDTMSLDAWEHCYNNGMIAVNLGLETASEKLMQSIGKKLNLKSARMTLAHLKKLGMYIHLTVLVNLPGEERGDRDATLRLLQEVDVDSYQVASCIPMPGTRMWKELGQLRNFEAFDGLKQLDSNDFPRKPSAELNLNKYMGVTTND